MTQLESSHPTTSLNVPAADPGLWNLDPTTVCLNHGSFGSCPQAVLAFQRALQDHLERQPVHFFVRELEPLWDRARAALATFVGAERDDLVFVPNATSGVNTVLRSLRFEPGDELLVTDHRSQRVSKCARLRFGAFRSESGRGSSAIPSSRAWRGAGCTSEEDEFR